jgi:hypothetical protein
MLANLGPRWHLYAGTCTLSPDTWAQVLADKDSPKARGGADHVSAVTTLWVDLDAGKDGHASKALPPTTDDALTIIATLPPPSWVVHTGGGVHAYWRLSRPLIIDDADSRADAEALTGGWNMLVAQLGAALGWHVDNVGDLSRVMRLPGSHNPKVEPPRPVQLVDVGEYPPRLADLRPWEPGPTYDPDELRSIVDARLVAPEPPAPKPQPTTTLPPTTNRAGTGPGLDVLGSLEHLPWSEIWKPGWVHVGDSTIKGTPCQLWRHPDASSDYTAKCTDGVAVVFSDSLPGLPSNGTGQGYNKAQIMAWRLYDDPNARGRLAKALAARRRQAKRQARQARPARPLENRP